MMRYPTPEERQAAINRTVSEWRERGELDYKLNDAGTIARLEDAREAAAVMSGAAKVFLSEPGIAQVLFMVNPEGFHAMLELSTVCHMLTCSDPECGINHPK
jgi:hypothetical protein